MRAFCAERGAAEEIGRSDYHVELLDRAASLRVIAGWDPDHERIYGRCLFAPSDELFRDPHCP